MSLSILVVDDETDVAALFRQHFRHEVRQGQYVLHFACSGEEARLLVSRAQEAFDTARAFTNPAVEAQLRKLLEGFVAFLRLRPS